jgi:hypothetical protein
MDLTPDSSTVRLANSPNWEQILPPIPGKAPNYGPLLKKWLSPLLRVVAWF